jgi:thioredoxin reductase
VSSGASARIENYLGFPTGISGQALAGRALNQAQKFGAEVAIPLVATRIECNGGRTAADDVVELTLSEQGSVRARAVVVASGARYKRPGIANLHSKATASITGHRRSRPSFAAARRSFWSAPATRPARRSCFSHPTSNA